MTKKILRGLFTIIGFILGYFLAGALLSIDSISKDIGNKGDGVLTASFYITCIILCGLIAFLFSNIINKLIYKLLEYIETSVAKVSANEIIFGTAGAIVGLIIAALFVNLFAKISLLWTVIAIIISIILAIICADIAIKKRDDITNLFANIKKVNVREKRGKTSNKADPKVLDTSVIIDGRIFDICQTGFVEGTLVIPGFVLQELRHIADSADSLKRTKGRRGLDILNKIQTELSIPVQIYEKDFPDIAEVDSKLLKLAQVLNGKVVTNDYNLNKVAQVQGVPVLNINELSNAVKPMVIAGEEMRIQIVKDGKETGQGIGYLDDGTMIVVEGGRKSVGEVRDVIVTSVLQTAAGRMIFAKQKDLSGENA